MEILTETNSAPMIHILSDDHDTKTNDEDDVVLCPRNFAHHSREFIQQGGAEIVGCVLITDTGVVELKLILRGCIVVCRW